MGVIIPSCTTKKKLSILNMRGFSWTHQRNEVLGQTAMLDYGEKTNPEKHIQDLLTWSKSHRSHKLIKEHLNGDFDELPRLWTSVTMENSLRYSLNGYSHTSMGFAS